ncbi:MAG: hypothetical protein DRH34_10165 [Deltaproteobacteria bacterium]|nr:MAG: hypothetical protein DRH34_10165 [Deltaproteobacteria bacterium]
MMAGIIGIQTTDKMIADIISMHTISTTIIGITDIMGTRNTMIENITAGINTTNVMTDGITGMHTLKTTIIGTTGITLAIIAEITEQVTTGEFV